MIWALRRLSAIDHRSFVRSMALLVSSVDISDGSSYTIVQNGGSVHLVLALQQIKTIFTALCLIWFPIDTFYVGVWIFIYAFMMQGAR